MVLLIQHPMAPVVPLMEDELIDVPEPAGPPVFDGDGSSVYNSNATTMPGNLQQDEMNGSHEAAVAGKSLDTDLSMRRCRISIVLVCLMFAVGLAVSILGVVIYLLDSVRQRDCAIWAGVPLAITGIIGIYYCGHEFEAYASSMRAFIVKCICLVLACASCCACTTACVFLAVHCWRVLSFLPCQPQPFHHCACVFDPHPMAQLFDYPNTENCSFINEQLWKYLLSQAVLNAVGSVITLWFVLMLWKSRYHGFYAGLKFYSYSATSSHHPSVSM